MEVWKDVKGFEGFYQVSNLGRVKRFYTGNKKTKILKTSNNSSGYPFVVLSIKSIKSTFTVHRLLMKSFYQVNDLTLDVNHKNGIKTDNRLENLEWCTRSQNIIHSIENSLTKTKLTKKDVFLIRQMLKTYKHKEIAQKFNVSIHTIRAISCGQTWRNF